MKISDFFKKRKAGIIHMLSSLLLLMFAAGIGIFLGLKETNGLQKYIDEAYEYYADSNWVALYNYAEVEDNDFINEYFFEKMADSLYGEIDGNKLKIGNTVENEGYAEVELSYDGTDGNSNTWKVRFIEKAERNYLFFHQWKLDVSDMIIKDCKVEAPAGFTVYVDGVELTDDNSQKNEDGNNGIVTYIIPEVFKGDHNVMFKAEMTEPLEVGVTWNEDGMWYALEEDKLSVVNSEAAIINNNAEMIVQLMYKAVFERTGIDEVSTYFVADEAVRAKLTAVYDAMVLAIEPEDGSTLNSMDITEFSEHDIKLIYPSQVNLLLSFNCTFSARGARQEGGGIREKYDGTATSITTFHFIKDNENWLCDDFTMECIDYSKEEVEEETEEE